MFFFFLRESEGGGRGRESGLGLFCLVGFSVLVWFCD